jgi:hypothetical protein
MSIQFFLFANCKTRPTAAKNYFFENLSIYSGKILPNFQKMENLLKNHRNSEDFFKPGNNSAKQAKRVYEKYIQQPDFKVRNEKRIYHIDFNEEDSCRPELNVSNYKISGKVYNSAILK